MSERADPSAEAGGPAQILLDSPAAEPALDFQNVAQTFARIIEDSPARFAVGIFGSWGCGKTTLMNAIEAKLDPKRSVSVRFNAWRFEREPHLLVPLLDAVRESLAQWASANPGTRGQRVRELAGNIGRVVRGLATGLSGEIGVPGARLSYDVGKGLDALGSGGRDAAAEPQSLYFAGFQTLSEALATFSEGRTADMRIVVFIDDLDRCLPASALEVLESIKLFFDLPGFVFVAGLDEQVVARAVATKLGDEFERGASQNGETSTEAAAQRERIGRDYIKKIFQVPYSLPPIPMHQLDDLLDAVYAGEESARPDAEQVKEKVRGYLRFVAVEGRINPREVKRFINAYTIQTLIRPNLRPDVMLALQTIAFRDEWRTGYETLLAESDVFKDALSSYRDGDEHSLEMLWPDLETVPSDFASYLRSDLVEPVTQVPSLEPYLFSLHSTQETQTWRISAYRGLGQLRGIARKIRAPSSPDEADTRALGREINTIGGSLNQLLAANLLAFDPGLARAALADLDQLGGELSAGAEALPVESDERAPLSARLSRILDRIQAEVGANAMPAKRR